MEKTNLLRYVDRHLPDFAAAGSPERLPQGNLNYVWRVPGEGGSIIVKHAPPYVASDPEVDLDPNRLLFELRSLQVLSPRGPLAEVSRPDVRPPEPLYADPHNHVLVMEDLGDVPPLGRWIQERSGEEMERVETAGRRLGAFIGRLHRITLGDDRLAEAFDNRAMQETRQAVQYEAATDLLRRGGVDDAEALGRRVRSLGKVLRRPGRCLTMGDLWPPSVLVTGDGLRVIDWELAHYGQPLQDLAHWDAHLWMLAHRGDAPTAEAAGVLRDAFWTAYRAAIGSAADRLWTDAMGERASIHFGAEILVRTVGRFQAGYLYDGLDPDDEPVQEAVATAAAAIRNPRSKLEIRRER